MDRVEKIDEQAEQSVLFVMTSMGVGGIQSALRNLIVELARRSSLKLTVLFFDKESVEKDCFPCNVEIIDAGSLPQVIALNSKQMQTKSLYLSLNRYIAGFFAKYISQKIAYKFLFRKVKLKRKWDVAISFGQTAYKSLYGGMNEFVVGCVNARKKIAFVHCDIVATHLNNSYSNKVYSKFDNVVLVSYSLKQLFDRAMPSLRDKTTVVYNCHDFERIKLLSVDDSIKYDKNVINFITVARFSPEKGLIRVLKIISDLKKEGLSLKWHIVGGGNSCFTQPFECKVKELGLEKDVICYGSQANPYRYMVNADILLVPSYHEAAPMVFQEAECLHIPVLTTKTCSALELVKNRNIGVVCENTEESICESMRDCILKSNHIFFKNAFQASNALAIDQFMDLVR